MSRIGFVVEDVTKDCANIPACVTKVFQVRAYDSGDAYVDYGNRYDAWLCRTVCFYDREGIESELTRAYLEEMIQAYEDSVSESSEMVEAIRVDETRALPILERGKTPTETCRIVLLKAPRRKERGESKQEYHMALIEYALELDRVSPVVC